MVALKPIPTISQKFSILQKPSILQINNEKFFIRTRILTTILNVILFGLSIPILILGILYLTVNQYLYSFTEFNVNLACGFLLGIGALVFILTIMNIVLANLNLRNQTIFSTVLISIAFITVLFLILLIIGCWGLNVSDHKYKLEKEVRRNLVASISKYDEFAVNKYETVIINWLQTKFECCGIDRLVTLNSK